MSNVFRFRSASHYEKPVLSIVFFVFLITASALAQDFKRQYKNAKDLFDEKSYNLAMESFKPLIVYDVNNPYSEYAAFFYSLSAYYQGYPAVAKDNLVQLKKIHPNWDQMDDVNYWLAKIYFDQRQYFQGLLQLKSIKSAAFKEDIAAMQRMYLSQIEDTETLKMVMEENPDNAIAAHALAKAISKQPIYQQDAALLDQLISKFNLDRKEFVSAIKPVSVKKDRYRVSLLFPFLANTLEPTTATKANQFVIDLYEGMKQAADTLAKQGIAIDLLAYDTEKSVEKLEKLLKTDELKSSDLIVGPFFPEEAKRVQEFSMANHINMINPVSNNSTFLGVNPYSMLFQPSFETLATKSAEMVAKNVRNKNCMVFFGETSKDSLMAASFVRKATELGLKVVLKQEIAKENTSRIQTIIATATDYDDYKMPKDFRIKRDSIGSIFVASDNTLIYSKVIGSVQTRGDSILVVGNENWIANEASINYDNFERLRVTLAAPNFVPANSHRYVTFRKKYIRTHGTLPSLYARMGYEFMDFIGKALHEYGVYYQDGLSQAGYLPGYLSPGYSFTNSRDNQHVPFVRVTNGELVLVNLKK